MKLEEKLTCLRQENRLTQMEVAEKLAVARQTVSKWETGVAVPTTESLAGLGRLYHVPVDYLLSEEAERPMEKSGPGETGDRPIDDHGSRRRPDAVRAASFLVLLALILGICIGYFVGKDSQDGEIQLYISKMKGEEIIDEPRGTFSIEGVGEW